MKTRVMIIPVLAAAVLLLTVGCATQPGSDTAIEKVKGEVIVPERDIEEWGGADSYGFAGDNPSSRYWVNPDFYRLKSDDQLTIIENFKTYQQTSEWSCGNCTALTTLHHFGITDYAEWDIAVAMGSSTDRDTEGAEPGSADNFYEYGTSVEQMYRFFESVPEIEIIESSFTEDYTQEDLIAEGTPWYTPNSWGNLPGKISSMSLYTSDNDDASENWIEDAADSWFVGWLTGHLKAGRPIMVEWGDWDGHWQSIIGYDNNGTTGIGDDVIILADPYDTSDHWQDGYYYYPMERWFYMWADRNVAPKPFQLQPYIIVDIK